MKALDGKDPRTPRWKIFPTTLWPYFAALVLSIVVASKLSTITFHLTAFNMTIYAVLLAGLLTGSRLCRLLLTFLTALAAYGILVLQIGALDYRDLVLAALTLIQLIFLSMPSTREFASHH